jgi:peptidoglycan/xylan/chitin deacetylase (PgdA/CDA1 family)
MKISIVIPTYNGRNVLARTFPAVLQQEVAPGDYEVVVVVDGSTDGTAEFVRKLDPACALHVVEQPNRGPGAARNAGIKAARGELVLLLDDDMRCDPDLARRHIAAHQRARSSLVFGPVRVAPESRPGLATDWMRENLERYFAEIRALGPHSPFRLWVHSNCSARRDVLLASGGYDESFRWAHEDADLAIRLWQSGVRFVFEQDIVVQLVYTKGAAQLGGERAVRIGASEARLCRKHAGYRPWSMFAMLGDDSLARRLPARLVCSSLPSPQPLLKILCGIAEQLSFVPPLRKTGLGLLKSAMVVAALRHAAGESGSWKALRQEFGLRMPILLYHHVGPVGRELSSDFAISTQRFERQVRWLARRGFVGIRLSDWLAWLREGQPLPEKPLLMTFDDGYADVAEHALPVLRRYGFSAVVYVATGQIGKREAWGNPESSESNRLMSADQIRLWMENGIEFGAHGRAHADLTALEDDRLVEEIEGSADDLTRILGVRPISFAYPYGASDRRVRAAAARVFELALGHAEGLNGLSTDPLLLRRTRVSATDGRFALANRVRFGFSPLQHLLQRARRDHHVTAPALSVGAGAYPTV